MVLRVGKNRLLGPVLLAASVYGCQNPLHIGWRAPDGSTPDDQCVCLALQPGGSGCPTAELQGTFAPTGKMTVVRAEATATLWPNGTVVGAGGYDQTLPSEGSNFLDSAETYDPVTGKFAATGRMAAPRAQHTATLLPDGRVLVVGGGRQPIATAELYDPKTGRFSATGSMTVTRVGHTATLLNDGRVLIAGGYNFDTPQEVTLLSAEIYDPSTATFVPTGNMAKRRESATATLLRDGRVLIAGGDGDAYYAAEIYDPTDGTFRATGKMASLRSNATATLLGNGQVLIAGGSTFTQETEIYDPTAGSFTSAGRMTTARLWNTATLLLDGRVLITGGYDGSASFGVTSAEIYDPATGTFSATASMTVPRANGVAALLCDGTVLVAGGMLRSEAEIYR